MTLGTVVSGLFWDCSLEHTHIQSLWLLLTPSRCELTAQQIPPWRRAVPDYQVRFPFPLIHLKQSFWFGTPVSPSFSLLFSPFTLEADCQLRILQAVSWTFRPGFSQIFLCKRCGGICLSPAQGSHLVVSHSKRESRVSPGLSKSTPRQLPNEVLRPSSGNASLVSPAISSITMFSRADCISVDDFPLSQLSSTSSSLQ